MSLPLSEIEAELRRAVESRNHAEVGRLACSYCAAVEAKLRGLPPGDPRVAEIARETRELLLWARIMLQSARELLAAQVAQLSKLRNYTAPRYPRPGIVQVDM